MCDVMFYRFQGLIGCTPMKKYLPFKIRNWEGWFLIKKFHGKPNICSRVTLWSNFVFLLFSAETEKKKIFTFIIIFLGFFSLNISRDAYRWYLMICNIQLLSSEGCFSLYTCVRPSVRPSRMKWNIICRTYIFKISRS